MSIQVCENYQPSKEIRNSYPLPTIYFHKWTCVLTHWQQNYRTRRALLKLNDEQLKDIGLSLEQAHKEASKAFWVG
ncbi:DUF1127 domain-containing protein [Neptuniibacter sp. QD37_11]|uniref:DUF1127 domain-containing protein n=1 Tax=Neptuniibacter sp. QD37_11 TaxID=3398209 RepID=UPI0039F5C8CC